MPRNKLLESPVDPIPAPSTETGPGQFDGETGLPPRTPSKNAVPERVRDAAEPKPV
jgi:hypothetical protein